MEHINNITSRLSNVLPKGSFYKRYIGGASWVVLGSGLSQAATFLALLVAARVLGSSQYGKFGIIQSTLGLFGTLAGIGLSTTNRVYIGELRNSNRERCGQIIGLSSIVTFISGLLIGFCLFVFSRQIALGINEPSLTNIFRISAGLLFLNALNDTQIGALIGFEATKDLFTTYAIRGVFTLVFVTLGVSLFGLTGLFCGLLITAIFVFIQTWIVLNKITKQNNTPIIYYGSWKQARILWRFTLPALTAGSLLPAGIFWVVRAIIIQYPNGYAELGVYTAAEQWLMILIFIPSSLNTIGLPILANLYSKNDRHAFINATLNNIKIPVIIAIIFGVIIWMFGQWLPNIYGNTFSDITKIMGLICIVGILRVFGGSIGNLLASINQMWWGLFFNLLWGGALISFTFLFAHQGAYGLASANIIAYSMHSIILSIFLWKILRKKN